jgi:O-antigen/teichoic acid export membrane protein
MKIFLDARALGGRLRRGTAWLLGKSGPVRERILRGGIWLMLGDALAKGGGLLKLAILGRLLSPNDFGLVGIAMAVMKALEYLTETGFSAALIQRAGDIRPYLDTAWSAQIVRSIVLAGATVAAAPACAWFFDNPDATPIIRAIAVVVVLRGFINPAVVHLRRDLDFQRVVLWQMSGMVAGLAVGVGLALVTPGVWALVLSIIAAQLAETVASYGVIPYRPRLAFDVRRARELIRFGKWIFWANVITFLGLYADSAAVGKLLGTSALGLYQMAYTVAMVPTALIGAHVRSVMFPAFSRIAERGDSRRPFLLTLQALSSVVVPLGAFVTVFATPIVRLMLGEQWLAIAPALAILVWAGVATALSGIANSLFRASARPDLEVKLALGQIVLWALLFYPLVGTYGLAGMATAVAVSTVLPMLAKLLVAGRMVGAGPGALVAVARVPVLAIASVAVAGLLAPAMLRVPLAGVAVAVAAGSGALLMRPRGGR